MEFDATAFSSLEISDRKLAVETMRPDTLWETKGTPILLTEISDFS